MNCENAKTILGFYDESEMAVEMAQDLQKHLQGCTACAKELAHREKLIRRLPQLPKLSETYWESYTQAVLRRMGKPQPTSGSLHWRWATALALSLLITSGALFYKVQERRKLREVITHLELLENLEVLAHADFDKWVSP